MSLEVALSRCIQVLQPFALYVNDFTNERGCVSVDCQDRCNLSPPFCEWN